MAHLSGLVDVPDEAPTLMVTDRGTVLVSLDTSTALRFRTTAALDAWLEQIDRARAPGVEAYQARVRELRAVKDAL